MVELLIVIIILAVLAGIAVPSYLSMTSKAKEAGTEAEMANIATALELYNADKGSYPATATTWNTNLQTGGYMVAVPTKDKWGEDYVYAAAGAGNATYTLTSCGKDGVVGATGGTDDLVWTNGQQTGMGAY